MNYITSVILAGTLVTIIVGVLLGLLRGMKRAILRVALLVLCFILALSLCNAISDSVMQTEISDGQTLDQLLAESLSDGGTAVADIVIPMAQSIAKVIVFVVLFTILQLVTWLVIFPILKLVLRPFIGKRHRKRLFGALVGAAGGLFCAFMIFVPLNGLLCEFGKIASIDLSGLTEDGDAETDLTEDLEQFDFAAYSESGISKMYSAVGGGFYRSLSTVKDRNGKQVTLSTQIDALSAAAKFATKAATLKNVMNDDGTVNTESIKEFAKALTELDELTPEAKEALNDMVKSATEALGDDVPESIKNLDLEQIDFKTEGDLLVTVADIVENEGSLENVDISATIEELSQSTVILPTLAESEVSFSVDEETENEIADAIADLESKTGDEAVDQATIDQLKALFGIGTN